MPSGLREGPWSTRKAGASSAGSRRGGRRQGWRQSANDTLSARAGERGWRDLKPGTTSLPAAGGGTVSGGFGGEGASAGSDDEPLGGAGDAAQETATFGGLQRGVAFASQGCGLQLLVGQIGLGGSELCPASLAIEGEVIEGFQILRGQDGFMGRRGVREELARHWAGRRG